MVNKPRPTRQASIRKICSLFLLLAGCQTEIVRTPVASPQATVGGKTSPIQPIRRKTVTVTNPDPRPITPLPPTETIPAINPAPVQVIQQPSTQPIPVVKNAARRSLELPNSLPNWRITSLSSTQWRIVPARRQNLNDAPPSLMADAIITSGIHARLKSVASLRTNTWKYSSNAGKVLLASPALTPNQALAALRVITTLDKVTEIRLTTTLR